MLLCSVTSETLINIFIILLFGKWSPIYVQCTRRVTRSSGTAELGMVGHTMRLLGWAGLNWLP